jgi:cytochrome c
MRIVVSAAVAVGVMSVAPAFAAEDLAKAKNCMACHAIDKKLVGPSYQDISAKYAGQADAVAMLVAKVQKGGSGVWGPVPMPPNPQISNEEANKLVEWVMSK